MKNLEDKMRDASCDAMFKVCLKNNNGRIWVVIDEARYSGWSYSRDAARELAKNNGGRVYKYEYNGRFDSDKKGMKAPRSMWILIDINNGDSGIGPYNYLWRFESYQDAYAKKEKQNSNINYARLIGPYRFSLRK